MERILHKRYCFDVKKSAPGEVRRAKKKKKIIRVGTESMRQPMGRAQKNEGPPME